MKTECIKRVKLTWEYVEALEDKALRYWKISIKALPKLLQKMMIITKGLIAIIIVSSVNIND